MGMRKSVVLLVVMAAALLMTGCSEPNATEQPAPEQEKKVVKVNEGMSKEEEEKLNERLAELEEKLDEKPQQEPKPEPKPEPVPQEGSEPEQATESAEDEALEAAQEYYAAAAAGNYDYTYDALTSAAQGQFSEEEWVSANTALGSDAGTYSIDSTDMVDDSTADVYLTITSADGSSSERFTQFVLENGSWKHELTQEEYALFAGATDTATATASASSSASASATDDSAPAAGLKHVKVVVGADVPVDVTITDDNFDWSLSEEITGTKTYENDIASDSGLLVSAMNSEMSGNVSIEVYENGQLKTQDTDSSGYAQVMY
jgi:sugar-specific transcriptional regulator TrmB